MCYPPRGMTRILFDFDGVWTDQAAEVVAIRRVFVEEAARLLGEPFELADARFEQFYTEVLSAPELHGWFPREMHAAFADEDALLATASVADWLDRGGSDPGAADWRRAIKAGGFDTVMEFANAHFGKGMKAARSEGHGLVPGAGEVLEALRTRGVDVVVASNSPPEKLEALFGAIGATAGPGFRLVGGAKKWWIEDASLMHHFGGRHVRTDRPHYRAILKDVRPDIVVGDVTSLDLALPAAMRGAGELAPSLRLLLRQTSGSPDWATSQPDLEPSDRAVDETIDSIAELLDADFLPR